MRLSGTLSRAISTSRGFGNQLYDLAGERPSLDLPFSDTKSLVDATTGQNLVTFTRASSGTYVDSQGVIRTATTNLQVWSEDFRNTADAGATRPWTYNTSAVTADNATAPNGATTADLVAGAAGTANKFLSNNVPTTATGFYTFSVFLKQGTEQFVVVRLTDGAANGIRGRFDLSAGTVVVSNEGTATGQAASVIAVGNGWYRCIVTCSFPSLSFSLVQPQLWLNNFASTSLTTNYYAWGAQLEQSSTVGEYIPTTSTINSAPRFDHNPTTGESLGLLVEESRTNSIRNNTMQGAVAGTPGTLPTNWAISGLGTLTQEVVGTGAINGINYIDLRFSGTTSTTQLGIRFEPAAGIAGTNGQTFSFSTWIARVGGSLTNVGDISANANIYTSASVYVASMGFSGFPGQAAGATLSRASGTGTIASATAAFIQPQIYVSLTSGTTIDITLRIGLPQLEQGAFATSVIPTSTATATRSADVASITGSNFSSWYRQDEGTVFVNATAAVAAGILPCYVSLDNGTTSERLQLRRVTSGTSPSYRVVAGGQSIDSATKTIGSPTGFNSQILAYSSNSYEGACNSVLEGLISIANLPSVTQTQIGTGVGGAYINGTIRRLTYWPQRLPNSTLQQITQ